MRWILRRKTQGVFPNPVRELDYEGPAKFHQFHCLDRNEFEDDLAKVEPISSKEDKTMRQSISAGERLSITVRFLATDKLQKQC